MNPLAIAVFIGLVLGVLVALDNRGLSPLRVLAVLVFMWLAFCAGTVA